MSENTKNLIVDEEISTSTWTKKKKYIFALSLLTILLVIITAGALIFHAYQRSQNGILSDDHENKSITNSPDIKQESFESVLVEAFFSTSTGYAGQSILLKFGSADQLHFKSQHWYKDGKKIDISNKSKYILQNQDLKIENLTEEDAGFYECSFIYGSHNKIVSHYLTIQDGHQLRHESFTNNSNKIEEFVSSFTGYTGYSILLKCDTTGRYWLKNSLPIDTSNKSKYTTHNGDLIIKNLTANDAGNYSYFSIHNLVIKIVSHNLKIQDAYKWVVPGSLEIKDPAYELFYFGDKKYFIGQIDDGKNLLPGLLNQSSDLQYNFVPLHKLDHEIHTTNGAKALMINKNVKLDWIDAINGKLPPNALEAGQLDSGEKLYIALLGSQTLAVVQVADETKRYFVGKFLHSNYQCKILALQI